MPGFFDLLIADEFHEFKAKGSAQGIAAGTLAEACGTSLTLTGTLMGGYASTLFHLLFRFSPDVRTDFGYHDESRWVSRYGFIEKRFTEKDSQATEHGRSSRRKSYNTRIKEIPRHHPGVPVPPHTTHDIPKALRRDGCPSALRRTGLPLQDGHHAVGPTPLTAPSLQTPL